MNGIEKVIEYIKAEAAAECEDIRKKAAEECERIRAGYTRMEQDEYWKYLSVGAKEAEQRIEQLTDLAGQESKKQVLATQREMVDAAFELAVKKLLEIPVNDYLALLSGLGVASDCSPEALVELYKEDLTPDVTASLFD